MKIMEGMSGGRYIAGKDKINNTMRNLNETQVALLDSKKTNTLRMNSDYKLNLNSRNLNQYAGNNYTLSEMGKNGMKLISKERWIEEPWHLSYPIIYKGKVIPEAYRSGKVYAYNPADIKPGAKEVLFDSGLIDQTFLEYDGKEWIFATDKGDALSGLKIYYRNSPTDGWEEHSKNPVKKDITNSRPGGHFFEVAGVLYRPVQDSKERYGRKIRIMRVDKLTVDDFQETEVAVFDSDKFPPYNKGFHTFNVEDGFIVVDGYQEKYSFFIKPLCVKMPSLMKKLGEKR
jgi:hypothetical protein